MSTLEFELANKSQAQGPIIKVIGVGGGGGNAVTNMYKYTQEKNNNDISFLLCNTDNQALQNSPIPDTLVLGPDITHGLGAGNKPELAEEAAKASREDIKRLLDDGTRMVFITAGLGGGTGTGAAPIISQTIREMDILTVGIITIPFAFEQRTKIVKALQGVKRMRECSDALLVINNEKLCQIYQDLTLPQAFKRADETLRNAALGISEMILKEGYINADFNDVNTTLKNGGVAIISMGIGEGEERLKKAIEQALTSPLLNNNDIRKAKHILFYIYHPVDEAGHLGVHEIAHINDLMEMFDMSPDTIWGLASDPDLPVGKIKITILASGFDLEQTEADIKSSQSRETRNTINQINDINQKNEEDKLISKYYGTSKPKSGSFRPIVLEPEEYDIDEIILELERTPALTRDRSYIEGIRKRLKNRNISGPQPSTSSTSSNQEQKPTIQSSMADTTNDNTETNNNINPDRIIHF